MATAIQFQAAAPAVYELARLVETSYLAAIAGKSARIFDGLEVKLETLRTRLAGDNPSPALELASEAAAHAWLEFWVVELLAANEPGRINLNLERRRTWSARRYNQALTTVERIRALTRPRGPRAVVLVNQAAALELENRTIELCEAG
jgi:hypothetical protein